MPENFQMIAKTFYGFEEILSRELKELGASHIKQGIRSVSFEGDTGFMYKANLCLRTALKILKPLVSFPVRNERELYQKVYAFDWESIMDTETTFAISSSLKSDLFRNSLYVSQRVKDAIADKFRNTSGKRPSIDKQSPDLRIHVHIQQNRCHISRDSSGASLHHRGYRTVTNIAPINEVLAAGLLLLSGWRGQTDFMDPMCGSGTILIEAVMIACRIPANINRKEFAFQKWQDYQPDLFEKIHESSLSKTREFHFKALGYDKAPSAVSKTKNNIENAGLSDYIQIERADFFHTRKQDNKNLHVLFNPPYGQRLTVDLEHLYGQIGNTLKRYYPNSEAWIITSNLEALKFVGLRPSRKIKLYNGKLESRLVNYSIYEGSKKGKYQTKSSE